MGKSSFIAATLTALAFSTHTVSAQQNLFNVPSSEMTCSKKIFFQEQLNTGSRLGQSNTTLTYGAGKSWEAGINLLNLSYDPRGWSFTEKMYKQHAKSADPMALINIQHVFYQGHSDKIGLGTQTGIKLGCKGPACFSYMNWVHKSRWDTNLIIGSYYCSSAFSGSPAGIGYQLGIDQPLKSRIHLTADYISGKKGISASVVGLTFYVNRHWMLSAGKQFPSLNSTVPKAFVFELTRT